MVVLYVYRCRYATAGCRRSLHVILLVMAEGRCYVIDITLPRVGGHVNITMANTLFVGGIVAARVIKHWLLLPWLPLWRRWLVILNTVIAG